MPDVTLRIGGRRFTGWKQVAVSRSIEALSGTFSLRATEISPAQLGREILLGDPCQVLLDDQVVISGHVDERVPSWSGSQHEVEIAGRDATGDLVDCSVTHEPGQWRNQELRSIVSDLVAPFGLEVLVEVGGEALAGVRERFSKFAAEPSETVYAAIERACRHRGVLATSDGEGHLVLTQASQERIPVLLEKGKYPVLEGTARFSERERYSSYEFRGQRRRASSVSAAQAASVVGRAEDPNVRRFRPSVQVAEEPGSPAQLRTRAVWEASVQQGRALRVDLVVAGWEWAPGELWRPNRLVRVRDLWLGVNADLLVAAVTWSKNASGTRTQLSLAPPEAFDLRPLPEHNAGVEEPAPELWNFDFSRFPAIA